MNQLLTFKIDLSNADDLALTFLVKLENITKSYLICVKFGDIPLINKNDLIIDYCNKYCPSDLKYFLNFDLVHGVFMNISYLKENLFYKQKKFVGFGIRELTGQENSTYCSENQTLNIKNLVLDYLNENQTLSDLSVLSYLKGCFHLNKTSGLWQTDGMEVGDDISVAYTNCLSTHLTDFSGSVAVLPASIDFAYAFANASFEQNPTIYATLITIGIIYLILFVWASYMDTKDKIKTKIHFLDDEFNDNFYFYEIVVFTGNRAHAGTNSQVK